MFIVWWCITIKIHNLFNFYFASSTERDHCRRRCRHPPSRLTFESASSLSCCSNDRTVISPLSLLFNGDSSSGRLLTFLSALSSPRRGNKWDRRDRPICWEPCHVVDDDDVQRWWCRRGDGPTLRDGDIGGSLRSPRRRTLGDGDDLYNAGDGILRLSSLRLVLLLLLLLSNSGQCARAPATPASPSRGD